MLGPTSATSAISSKALSETEVYPLIHLIRVDVISHIDTPLTYEQLNAPDSTYTIVRPLMDKYLEMQNQSIIFCLLLNKVQFVHDSAQLSINTLSISRATLCEILAIRVLRGWSERTLPLATVLLTPWGLYQGASKEVMDKAKEEGDDDVLTQGGSALEMAIISYSKRFIRSPSCQKVIEGIWSGRIIYSAANAHALIADNYKKRPIQLYNPHKAPLLDHYRLKVPKVRSFLEYANFVVLFVLYVVAVEGLEVDHMNGKEVAFIVYALAYSLDKMATIREHGLKVFSSSLVNGFDLVFMFIYAFYVGSRTYGFHYHDIDALSLGQDWLAIGAVLIFPRLAFVTLANNLMVLSLRSMLVEFFFLMCIGIFCFLGFLYALFTLGQGRFELSQIGWWLLEVYFGLDASGFETSHDVHPFLGPFLMVTYALLSNTLLLTVLVAILGNTFATINSDAAAESMFRNAVSTIEGVKADAVFSYQLPFNLVAVVVMWPMSYILSPRWFHKLNVVMIRASNFPVLLLIALYERQQYRETSMLEAMGDYMEKYVGSLPRRIKQAGELSITSSCRVRADMKTAGFDNFGSRRDIDLVFEIEREVGTFYRDTPLEDPFEEDVQLPPAADDEDPEAANGAPSGEPNGKASPAKRPPSPEPPLSPNPRGLPRSSRVSFSALPRHRRNSTMHEPSPLARLFVGDGPSTASGLRERRQTQAMATSFSLSPATSGSGSTARPMDRRSTTSSRPGHLGLSSSVSFPVNSSMLRPISPVREGKKADGGSRGSSPPHSAVSPMSGSFGNVPFPKTGSPMSASDLGDPPTEPAAKASDVEGMEEEGVKDQLGTADRLAEIEKRQKKIEELLQRLIDMGTSGSDGRKT